MLLLVDVTKRGGFRVIQYSSGQGCSINIINMLYMVHNYLSLFTYYQRKKITMKGLKYNYTKFIAILELFNINLKPHNPAVLKITINVSIKEEYYKYNINYGCYLLFYERHNCRRNEENWGRKHHSCYCGFFQCLCANNKSMYNKSFSEKHFN